MKKVNPFMLLAVFVLVIVLFYFIAKGILKLLSLIAPVLFIGALLINYRVVIGYGKWIIQTYKRNVWFGLAATLFTIFGAPLVAAFLLVRALASKGFALPGGDSQAFTPYEEVDETNFLDLEDVNAQRRKIEDDYRDILNS
ncbi:MAG: hypothetical protein AAFQ02_03750 [Bacteroidota bacterium]